MFARNINKNCVQAKNQGFGIYVHWPFCLSKCPYCDFNSHVSDAVDHNEWAAALSTELLYSLEQCTEKEVTSVFFGGGTPSLMNSKTVEIILQTIFDHCKLSADLEITLEANPTSIESTKFKDFARAGINRVSVGVQSLIDDDLQFLGRQHTATEALKALDVARANFDRYSFDLIYARPSQTLESWEKELSQALLYGQGHLSLYQLTIEQGTAFYTKHERGDFQIPQEDLAADFYDLTEKLMNNQGYKSYEVSNYAILRQESRHNLTYWRYGDYLGVGPGAHGRITTKEGYKIGTRTHRAPAVWLEKVKFQNHGWHEPEILTQEIQNKEAIMMGLRLQEGVAYDRFANKEKINLLVQEGQALIKDHQLILTHEGRMRLNSILAFLFRGNP